MRKFFRALKRAQRDIDLRPELYTHYYRNEFPEALSRPDGHAPLGSGRAHRVRALLRKEIFEESRDWIRERGIFEGNDLGAKSYESAVVRLAV